MNWNFIAHIIRDVFPPVRTPIIYGQDTSCLEVFRTSLHGLGFNMLYSGNISDNRVKFSHHWSVGEAIRIFGADYCDLFLAFDEETVFPLGGQGSRFKDLYYFMKPGGLVWLINPDDWSKEMDKGFKLREDYIKEIKSYSIFKDERVVVYEKV